MACENGHLDIVRVLLQSNDILVNQPNQDGTTSLFIACQNGHLDIVRVLLKLKNIQVNQPRDSDGTTPLISACFKGHLDIVRELLQSNGIQINQPRKDGTTPLITACVKGHFDIVRVLLQSNDIQINQPNTNGATPLMIARHFRHNEILQLLISNGATPPFSPPFRRGGIDHIGLHTIKKCLNNHGLLRFNTPNERFACDICEQAQQMNSVMFGCDECNYDLCVNCEQIVNTKEDENSNESSDDEDMQLALALSMSKESGSEDKMTAEEIITLTPDLQKMEQIVNTKEDENSNESSDDEDMQLALALSMSKESGSEVKMTAEEIITLTPDLQKMADEGIEMPKETQGETNGL
jgi:ankyrin repeat protein